LVQELRQESALEKLAQQKFDFSVSCISPTLQRLQILKLQNASVIPESEAADDNRDCPVIPRRKCAVAFMNDGSDKTMGLVSRANKTLEDKENIIDFNNNDLPEQAEQLEIDCDKTTDDKQKEIIHDEQPKLLNVPLLGVRPKVQRSYSEGVPIGLQIKDLLPYDSEKDWKPSTPDAAPYSHKSNKLSNFQRFRKDRRSWAPGSSFAGEYANDNFSRNCGNRSSFRKSLHADFSEEDSVSVLSDMSILSEESTMSGMSSVSVPVHGKHATKKRYHKLRDLFKQFRSKDRG
jgi:hypothetical protein